MRLAAFLVLAISLLPAHSTCQAQQFGMNRPPTNASRFIATPRSLNQLLREAESAIEERQYSEAIVILGDLLERDQQQDSDRAITGQDFFLDIQEGDQQRLDRSFLRHCRQLIGDLPSKARETYELRYGALAKQLLDSATETRNWQQLAEVRRKYFHTQAGYSASAILAQRQMFLGNALAASMLLDDLVENSFAISQLGDGIRLMHAASSRLAGRRVKTDPASVNVPYQIAGNKIETPIESWRAWADKHYLIAQQDWVSRSLDYPMLGGNAGRNDTSQGQMPLTTPRWMVETTATPREEKDLRRKSEELAASGQLVPPSWMPIRVKGQLLMRTTERLMGVDHRTGKRVWQYPWFETKDSLESEQATSLTGRGVAAPADRLSQRVWNDVPYGQIVSDGERVFLLDDLSTAQTAQISALVGIRNVRAFDASRNTLVALELETEGKMLWRLGQNPTIESELNDAFFLGAPLAVDGSLYSMVELAGDILLVCLDPSTGVMRWKQQLVAVEGLGIQFDPLRRVSGATPSYHQGVLICPTGASATVAVNLIDRTLRWGNSYPRRSGPTQPSAFSRTRTSNDDFLSRWHHPAPVVSGNTVIVTSPVTDMLFCYDLVDGKQRFKKTRQASFFVAGIRDGQVLTVNSRKVVSYDLRTGRFKWETKESMISPGQQIVGRGVFGDQSYIIPTTGNELIRVSTTDGSEISRRVARFPLGNLIAIDGEIISQGATQLAVALGTQTLGPRVEKMLQENPDDLDALIQKALLLAEQGKRTESLEILQRARTIDPESDDVLILSINAMLGVLREAEVPPSGMLEELDQLIDTPSQQLEFLALKIENAMKTNSVTRAAEGLFEFSTVLANADLLGNEDESILRDSERNCTLDAWVAGQAKRLVDMAEELNATDELEKQFAEFVKVKRLGSSQLLAAMVKHYQSMQIDDIVHVLAKRKIDDDRIGAERLLLGTHRPNDLFDPVNKSISIDRKLQLASLYATGQFSPDALKIMDSLSTEALEQAAIPSDSKDNRLEKQISAVKSVVESASLSPPALPTEQRVTLKWNPGSRLSAGRRILNSIRISKPDILDGETFQGWSLTNGISGVTLQTPWGEDLRLPIEIDISNRRAPQQASVSGGILLLEQPGAIHAIDLFSVKAGGRSNNALLWSREFSAGGPATVSRQTRRTRFGDSMVFYPARSSTAKITTEFRVGPILGDRVFVLHSGDLMALGFDEGETLWRNAKAPGTGALVTDDGKVAVVSNGTQVKPEVVEFDVLDGKLLGRRPWEYGIVWASCGKNILAYTSNAAEATASVRLVNPIENEVLLETEFLVNRPKTEPQGLGRVLQDRYLVLFDSNGELVIWDLQNANELCRHSFDEMPNLETLHAMWMDGQILVLPANSVPRTNRTNSLTAHGETHRTVHRMVAISTETGEVNWQRNFDQPWGCTITQPQGSPVIAFARTWMDYSKQPSQREMDVMLLNVSDGKTLHEQLRHKVPSASTGLATRLTVRPLQQSVLVEIENESLIYRFGVKEDAIIQP